MTRPRTLYDKIWDEHVIRTEDDERLYIHESGFASGHVPTGRCAGTEMSSPRELRSEDVALEGSGVHAAQVGGGVAPGRHGATPRPRS